MSGTRSVTKKLLDHTQARMAEHVDLLRALVAIPSHASVPGGTDDVAAQLLPSLESFGFAIEAFDQEPLEEDLRWVEQIMIPGWRQEEMGRTYRAKREDGPERVLILGDLDTSYTVPAHRTFPVRQEGPLLYAPGIADMRGGLVVMIAALRALDDAGLGVPSIEIVLAGDEQAGSFGSRHLIKESALRSRWTMCVECARRGGKLMAARGHIGVGDLTAIGVEAHAGSAHHQGINAIDLLARVIPVINDLSIPDEGILVTVTLVSGGTRRSVIPGQAHGVLDIRTPSASDWEITAERIQETVARYGGGSVRARTHAHRPAVHWTSETDGLLQIIGSVASEIGVNLGAFRSLAAGSSAFAAEAGSVVMDGMGPVGGGLMTPNEYVDTSTIPQRAAILAATLARLGDQK